MLEKRRGIALLITLLFMMLITLSIGVGLKHIKKASNYVKSEKFLLQTNIILDDVLTLLESRKELSDINSSDEFSYFLAESSFIPFEASGIKISLEISSARSKFNINSLRDKPIRVDYLKQYLSNYNINIDFVDILLDSMGGMKEDYEYNYPELFSEKPYLFRDYIVSDRHFNDLGEFYEKTYRDDSLKNVDFTNLFYFANDNNDTYKIDLSSATAEVWEMMLGCDKLRAEELSAGIYDSYESMDLSSEELRVVREKFKTSFFEPYIYVVVNIIQDDTMAKIEFEYNIRSKKGSNFVYKI